MELLQPAIRVHPVRTPTLPPATHTNVYVLGHTALTVVDPASCWEEEQDALLEALDALELPIERILLTHHHFDHVGGAVALQTALRSRGLQVPICAHPRTAELLEGTAVIDELVEDGQLLNAGEATFRVRHTPGHAPGHVILMDEESGAIVAGDMVAGVGTILINPEEGSLGEYLASLEMMRQLSPEVLLPSHGPALWEAEAVLGFYIAHRHQRSDQIRQALAHGMLQISEIADRVYPELDPAAKPLAHVQVHAHLLWLKEHGVVSEQGQGSERWGLSLR